MHEFPTVRWTEVPGNIQQVCSHHWQLLFQLFSAPNIQSMEECTSGSQLLDEDLNVPGDSPGVHSQLGPKPHTDDSMEVVVIQSL